MKELFIGEVIRRRRKELGMSQEELCGEICEPATLSRLETGKQTPSRGKVNALLQRLDLPADRYYAMLTAEEELVENLCKEITSCNVRYQSALTSDRPAIRAEGYRNIHTLEQVMDKDDHITAQIILRSQVLLGKEDGEPYTLEEKLELLTKAMRLTVPRFDLEQIEKGLYTVIEVKILNQFALAYSNDGQRERSIELYQKLLDYAKSHFQKSQEANGLVPLIAHNYALQLRMLERYPEAIEIGEMGRQVCMNYGHYEHLGGILHTLGECYHFLGDEQKALHCFFEAYFQYTSAGDKKGVALLQADANAYYGTLKALTVAVGWIFG